MSDQKIVEGGCFCGAVKLKVKLPVKWVAHCHCSMCRRAHGAAFVTWAGNRDIDVDVKGREHLVRFASSEDATRDHCRVCGTQLLFRGDRWPGEVHIPRALLGDVEKEPQSHVFFSDAVSWVHVDDHLPKKGGKTGTEPL